MSLQDSIKEYAVSRARDTCLMSWVGGSLAALAVAYITSPGRQLAKVLPPPPMSRVMAAAPLDSTKSHFVHRSSWQKFWFLVNIAVPSWKGAEAKILAATLALLLLRTVVAVKIAQTTGSLGRAAAGGHIRQLFKEIALYIASVIPASVLNVTLDYMSQMLEVRFRVNVTKYFHTRYLKNKVFFRLAGLHLIGNIDQRLTEDIDFWSRMSSRLFSSVLRPLIEALTFTVILSRQTGRKGPALTWSYYLTFVYAAFHWAPNIDWLAHQRLEKEGAFRTAHQNVLAFAEEICMTKGTDYQKTLLNKLFKDVTDQSRYAAYVHARFNLLDHFYNRYGASLLGFIVCGMSIAKSDPNITQGELMGRYSQVSYEYQVLSKAVGRLLWNWKLFLAVNGYTQRVFQLEEAVTLADIQMERQQAQLGQRRKSNSAILSQEDLTTLENEETYGRISLGEHIEFIDVPLTLPNNEVLCADISFYVKPGMNLLIMGPNGCGKSSTFRLLGELWPLRGGRIIKPVMEEMYYVPQRPYMFDGTLFEQIIYPHKAKDVLVSESEAFGYLEKAGLGYLLRRSSFSWNTCLSWTDDTLSLGEKQRLAMARLFYHRPRFAILDECTSLIDLDVERQLYETCAELGISLITIAHRRSVWKYHNYILYFDGCGSYMFSPLRVEMDGAVLVLKNVQSATDEKKIGTEFTLRMSDYWEDEQVSAQIAEDKDI